MGEFFNSIGQVYANRKNLKKWEDDQNYKEAQRSSYFKKSAPSQAELNNAEKYGRTVVDAVDVMDMYSEDKVEDVEMATNPLTAFISIISLYGATFLSYIGFNKSDKKYQKIDDKYVDEIYDRVRKIQQEKIDELEDSFDLKTINEKEIFKQKMKIYDEYNIGYISSMMKINKSKKEYNPEIKAAIKEAYSKFEKEANLPQRKIRKIVALGFVPVAFIAATAGSIMWATSTQKQAARIARYQARENELIDPRNFVVYNNRQIKKAKEIAATMPDAKKPKKQRWFSSISSLIKDRKYYKEWKKNQDIKDSNLNFENLKLTPEQLEKAKGDQEVLTRTVKKINNTAEDYAEHMETTGVTLLTAAPVGGALLGSLIKLIPGSKKLSDKILKSLIGLSVKNNKHTRKFHQDLSEEQIKKLIDEKFDNLKPFLKSRFFNFAVGGIVTIVSIPIALNMIKMATRAGRFEAKQELMKNPENFIPLNDEQRNSEKDVNPVKEKRGFFSRIKQDMEFIPKSLKMYSAYNKHKKVYEKENIKFREALKQVELESGQMEQAKNLQSKVFNTFEKVDEMSQRYSEDIEAATSMAEAFAPFIGIALGAAPLSLATISVIKGNAGKAIKNVSGLLSKMTGLLKLKFTKDTLGSISQSVEKNFNEFKKEKLLKGKSGNQALKAMKEYERFLNRQKKDIDSVKIGELKKEAKTFLSSLKEGKNKDTSSKLIDALLEGVDFTREVPEAMEEINKKIPDLKYKHIDLIEKILTKGVNSVDDNEFKELVKLIPERYLLKNLNKSEFTKILDNVGKILDNIPENELDNLIKKMASLSQSDPDTFNKFVTEGKLLNSVRSIPQIKTLIRGGAAASASLMFLFNYLVDVYFSRMQLTAGRVGTMKAIEGLSDPRYFADVNQVSETKETTTTREKVIDKNNIFDTFKQKVTSTNT